MQHTLNIEFESIARESDIVFTPEWVSEDIIKGFSLDGICLDPCKGDGAFYKYLPNGSKYCELREGRDFFQFKEKVNWIIGNPPYSIFEEFLKHSFSISNNVSYLLPTNKVFQRQLIMDMINDYGGIKSIKIYGSGFLIGVPFGFSVGNFHFQKGYTGATEIKMGMKTIFNTDKL
ncbi:hypothetical protein [Aquimarina algiphila]|uniref:hypothetical protein n=1 Tax=Aquimarina algiphila TaxID=2047982 RepID=UPI00232CC945|nr:hypothetical protein [Aquimarina algiphila]